ncbi:hypothetical protein DL96DRAFT_1667688 [Flagelloscypha sp. PMI_526]|nr:hypothetical protein DL96DRAFT_1667688 [Flagelloscypha sp. PMI_526]
MITFYDIPSSLPGTGNTIKTRLALKFKGLPFTTEWIEYPDIEAVSKEVGSPPTSTWPDGTPYYTCPFIHDTETGKTISDSWNIALYLDEMYPDTPRLIPKGCIALMSTFVESVEELMASSFANFCRPQSHKQLNEASQAHFKRVRELRMGRTFEEMNEAALDPKEWDKVKAALDKVDALLKLNNSEDEWAVGDKMTYADILVSSKLYWWKTFGAESQKSKDVLALNGGRWGRLIEKMEELKKDE